MPSERIVGRIRSERKYLSELAKQYPTRGAVAAEIIRLNGLLNLPKGTEHFLSDIHGEWEAFSHIRRNASGVVRNKVKHLFDGKLSEEEQAELASLVYYPSEKLDAARERESLLAKSNAIGATVMTATSIKTPTAVRSIVDNATARYTCLLPRVLTIE